VTQRNVEIDMQACSACGGTGYSDQARVLSDGLVNQTFDALERHSLVVDECVKQAVSYKCPVCHGDGIVKH